MTDAEKLRICDIIAEFVAAFEEASKTSLRFRTNFRALTFSFLEMSKANLALENTFAETLKAFTDLLEKPDA